MAPAPESGEPVRVENAEDSLVAMHPVNAMDVLWILQKVQQEAPEHDPLDTAPWKGNPAAHGGYETSRPPYCLDGGEALSALGVYST